MKIVVWCFLVLRHPQQVVMTGFFRRLRVYGGIYYYRRNPSLL
jgi:hypothetical protein